MPRSNSPQPHVPRGFTLIELLVGAVATSIILFGVAFTVAAVQGSYQAESRIKVAVEGVRTATTFIEQRLRLAGYGVDPRFAFDFDPAPLPNNNKTNEVLSFGAGVPVSVTDDLAFRYRDPSWLRRGTYTAEGLLTLEDDDTFGMDFREGQRFIVSCVGGRDYLMLRVLDGGLPKGAKNSNNFEVDARFSSVGADAGCLTRAGTQAPYIMLMHEVRIRVMDMGGRPFLMAFQGIDELDEATAVPLAADVESFQVAYVMNRPPPAGAPAGVQAVDSGSVPVNWVLGDVGSVDLERIPDPNAVPAPLYETPYDDAARYNKHPANIRAVRVTISVRSTRPESSGRRAFPRVDLEDSDEDEDSEAQSDGYYRTNMTTTVRVPNLMSRSAFNPEVGTSPADNAWGG
ncbi:prepilin-type cleavage/methylation domain-containing protein [Archangium minus]|uniref:Prepilin-type cleavage/methylation domain-containing protein n=1 Tax=Archangium minus TaxID=83450 RepID=A0ABY9X2D7_9BACT|nr:prepilin-type cleavage/methylation domain-containing protein [Archangium minus]